MSVRRLPFAVLAALLVFSFACNKPAPPEPPKPAPAPPAQPAPEPPKEVTVAPTNTSDDVVESPLDGDLLSAQRYAEENGLLGTVYFDFDRSDLSSSARERLAKNADFLKQNGQFVVTIEGHCDERGTSEYNLALGERRANAALDYITGLGVASSRIRTISYGEERGACADSNESCWGQNRRAYFRITGRN